MNEFPDPSQQPTDDPLGRLRSSDTPPIPERLEPARPAGQPERFQPARPAGQPERFQPARPAGQPERLEPAQPAGQPERLEPAQPAGQPERFQPAQPAGQLERLEPARSPVQVRVVWNAWPGEIGGVGVWDANRQLFTVVEELLDPRLLAADLVGAAVQAAALHAGIPQPVAGWMGQAAKNWFLSLSEPGPDASKVQAVQAAVDLALSAENGSVTNSSAVCKSAVDETVNIVERLLGPGAPPPDGLESFFATFMSPPSSFRPPPPVLPLGGGFSPM